MAIVKPQMASTSNGESIYTGFLPVGICNFKDRSDEFQWADIFLSVELQPEGSDYTRFLELNGKLDFDMNHDITGGFVLKRLYHLFDLIGFKGGINNKGTWEEEDGTIIDDIGAHLTERFSTSNPIDTSYDYMAYLYKEMPRKAGDKSYTKVHHRLFPNTPKGVQEIKDHVSWMKSKRFIKEWDGPSMNGVATDNTAVMAENL
tara:strand:- start:2101 stop:2709 length:609 start_codon:yes stop_codon:yes gene_type:complete